MNPRPIRDFPHLIILNSPGNHRHPIHIADRRNASSPYMGYAFYGHGSVDQDGGITQRGIDLVRSSIADLAVKSGNPRMCVVWTKDSCTYFLPDRTTIESKQPPVGAPIYCEEWEAFPVETIDCHTFKMPPAFYFTHLCVRLLEDRVEISSGSPMILGYFDEDLPTEGPGSALRRFLDADGRLVRPDTFRGVPTTPHWPRSDPDLLYGPVQPDGMRRIVTSAWPSEVFTACRDIAELKLPEKTLLSIWKRIEAEREKRSRSA